MKVKVIKKIDFGEIMLETSQDDINALSEVIQKGGFPNPTVKISIYKNRRGRHKNILLWCRADRGTCRIIPMFATDYSYELVQIDDLKIKVKPSLEASAF